MTVTIGNKLNISNRNFCTFMSALGVEYDNKNLIGTLDSSKVLKLLNSFDPDLALRSDTCGPNWVDYGITVIQVKRYCDVLRELCLKGGEIHYA